MPVVPKLCSGDPKRSAISSQGIRGYISVMANLKFIYFSIIYFLLTTYRRLITITTTLKTNNLFYSDLIC